MATACAVLAFVHLSFFAFNRTLRVNVYFAGLCLCIGGIVVTDYLRGLKYGDLLDTAVSLSQLERALVGAAVVVGFRLAYTVGGRGLPRRFWPVAAAVAIVAPLGFISGPIFRWSASLYGALGMALGVELVVALVSGVRRRQRGIWLLVTGFGWVLTFQVADGLAVLDIIDAAPDVLFGRPELFVLPFLAMLSAHLARESAFEWDRARQAEMARAREYVRNVVVSMQGGDGMEEVVRVLRGELRRLGVACDQVHIEVAEGGDRPRRTWSAGEGEEASATGRLVEVPFEFGTLAMARSPTSATSAAFTDDEVEVLQGFAEVVSLGYARFLDFERVEAQNRALADANEQIRQASLNKSQFLRRMSHDLRSPMNAILGYTRILRRRLSDRIGEREARNLANIETSSSNLLSLINDILDLSRIEAGRIELDVRSVDVRALAGECADALEPIVKSGVELRRELEVIDEIRTDPDRLRQVMMNLLGNATKFTDSGRITLGVAPADNGVELWVTDTGVGIPPEDLPHIFDEFRQVERQGGGQVEGTGLGLAIVKKTVDLLGGTIRADSEVGAGTTFRLRIGNLPPPSDDVPASQDRA